MITLSIDDQSKIRLLHETDLDQIKRLHNECFPIVYDAEFYRSLLRPDRLCLVACIGETICGSVTSIYNEKTGDTYIMTLAVTKNFRKIGIASKLLKKLFDIMLSSAFNANRISLHVLPVNQKATSLYMKAGFIPIRLDRGHYLINNRYHDAIYMQHKMNGK